MNISCIVKFWDLELEEIDGKRQLVLMQCRILIESLNPAGCEDAKTDQ